MAGEYGPENGRPHFHALLFGVGFSDRRHLFTSKSGSKVYESEQLTRLWGHGFASVGDVTYESASYTARYIYKKMVDGGVYDGAVGEFSRMSLKPGIGSVWFDKFGRSDVLPSGKVLVNGRELEAPRFYREKIRASYPLRVRAEAFSRDEGARAAVRDSAPDRLVSKEIVMRARVGFSKRKI